VVSCTEGVTLQSIEVEVDGTRFLWSGRSWTDDRFLQPPARVRGLLMGRLVQQLEATADDAINLDLVTAAARVCFEAGQLRETEQLARRVLRAEPRSIEAAMLLAEVARRQRRPREALEITEPFGRRRSARLHSLRAAAFADIGDWDAADKALRRAIKIDKADVSTETLRVMARIVAARTRSTAA